MLADRLKALGDPTRLRMLDLLAQQPEPLCVCDLTPRFSQNQPTISHHLKLLREAGLIAGEKQGSYPSHNSAKKALEFTVAIPRAELRPRYGDGFAGAPIGQRRLGRADDLPI